MRAPARTDGGRRSLVGGSNRGLGRGAWQGAGCRALRGSGRGAGIGAGRRAERRGAAGGKRGVLGAKSEIRGLQPRMSPPNTVPTPLCWPSTIPPVCNSPRDRLYLTMATAFANLSLDCQRSAISANDLWEVTRVYRSPGVNGVQLTAKHGPSQTEVAGIPGTSEMLSYFAVWFAYVTGQLPMLDRALLRSHQPSVRWLTWSEVVESLRALVELGGDTLLQFIFTVTQEHR